MNKVLAAICALAAVATFEYFVMGLASLSATPWGVATLGAGVLLPAIVFLPTNLSLPKLSIGAVVIAALPVVGTSGQIFSQNFRGQEYRNGHWVDMQPPAPMEHLYNSTILFAILLALALIALTLWKRIVFR
jgi:hypothetical protein